MTECNGCGACCHPFAMVYSAFDLERLARSLDATELAFYREHLTPMRRADGRRMTPWNSGWSEFVIDGHVQLVATHYYKCDNYDEDTRRCTDYDNRPDVCRGFPWYDRPPDERKVLPPTCSYNADIGMPVAPVPVAAPTRRPPSTT
jgi:Fe-S-cluster containining protein